MVKKGVKYDSEKPRWDLLPWRPIREIVKVLTYGSIKYSDDNWQQVKPLKQRYFAALMRHLDAWWTDGETRDPESGLYHLAHAGCCLVFLLWSELKGKKDGC